MRNKTPQKLYDVIIVGGGPVGIALGIELGMQNIRALVLEKYDQPLHSVRAQSLSARSMEFFLRWKIDTQLENSMLLPPDLPACGVWCSQLNGDTYFVGTWGDNELDPNCSPKQGLRIPLWITEKVLRARLQDFPSIDFLKNQDVQNIRLFPEHILVQSVDRLTKKMEHYKATFVAACDGAKGISKEKLGNPFRSLSDKTKILSINFISHDLIKKKTVPDGIFYWVLSQERTAFLGPIDIKKGSWFAQIICDNQTSTPDKTILSQWLDRIAGSAFNKEIINFHFWDMQVQLADFFSLENRVFWLGDAAHAFAPTGGLGLNTGLGDAVNLGWKLASVLRKEAPMSLLATYEQERRPVCIDNLGFAQQNAKEVLAIKKQYPPEKDYKAFALANAALGKRFLSSSHLTMGYAYHHSPLTQDKQAQRSAVNTTKYIPTAEPGYFLPHRPYPLYTSIYEALSPTCWNLLVCNKATLQHKPLLKNNIRILEVDTNLYPHTYLLVRPDWHISQTGNNLESITWSSCFHF